MEAQRFKRCIVPKCNNTTTNAINKGFLEVPSQRYLRCKWRNAMGGFQRPVSMETDNMYCCEDHFDVQNDTTNYSIYRLSRDEEGSSKIRLLLKENVVPYRFECQKRTGKSVKMVPIPDECSSDKSESSLKYTELNDINILNRDNIELDMNTIVKEKKYTSNPELNNDTNLSGNNFSSENDDIAIKNRRLIALCKPVKIVLNDLVAIHKNIRTWKYDPNIGKQDLIVKEMSVSGKRKKDRDELNSLKKRRKLIPKVLLWEREQTQCIEIHDEKTKEVDIYYFNSSFEITTYKRYSYKDNNTFETEFWGHKENLTIGQCCCWYRRESFIKKLPTKFLQTSIKFIKKSHKCKNYNCSCCCRNIFQISRELTSKSTELPNIRQKLNLMTYYKSLKPDHLASSVIRKSLIYEPKTQNVKVSTENVAEIVSMKIKLSNDYYEIGSDGNIALYIKNVDTCKFSSMLLDIDVEICCWYKREQFTNDLLHRKVRKTTINFLRTSHLCKIECKCCCKPKQSKKATLPKVSMIKRHTTEINSRNLKMKIQLPVMTQSNIIVNWSSKTPQIFQRDVYENALTSSVISLAPNMIINKNSTKNTESAASTTDEITDSGIVSNAYSKTPTPAATVVISDDENYDTAPVVTKKHPPAPPSTLSVNKNRMPIAPKSVGGNYGRIAPKVVPTKNVTASEFVTASVSAANQGMHNNTTLSARASFTTNMVSSAISTTEKLTRIVVNNLEPSSPASTRIMPDSLSKEIIPFKPNTLKHNKKSLTTSTPTLFHNKSTMTVSPSVVRGYYSRLKGNLKYVRIAPKVVRTKNVPAKEFVTTTSIGNLTDIIVTGLFPTPVVSNEKATQTYVTTKSLPKVDVASLCKAASGCTSDIGDKTNNKVHINKPFSIPPSTSSETIMKCVDVDANPIKNITHLSETDDIIKQKGKTVTEASKIPLLPILSRLKHFRFINKPGEKITVQLDMPLKNLPTTELRILNNIFYIVKNQLSIAGLNEENFQFDFNSIFDNIKKSGRRETDTIFNDPAKEHTELNAPSPMTVRSEEEEQGYEPAKESSELNSPSPMSVNLEEEEDERTYEPVKKSTELNSPSPMTVKSEEEEDDEDEQRYEPAKKSTEVNSQLLMTVKSDEEEEEDEEQRNSPIKESSELNSHFPMSVKSEEEEEDDEEQENDPLKECPELISHSLITVKSEEEEENRNEYNDLNSDVPRCVKSEGEEEFSDDILQVAKELLNLTRTQSVSVIKSTEEDTDSNSHSPISVKSDEEEKISLKLANPAEFDPLKILCSDLEKFDSESSNCS